MANSSSSKYVKRRRHRHVHGRTKSRRHAKKYTIRKVMHGCSSRQNGGAVTEVPIPPNTVNIGGQAAKENLIGGAKAYHHVAAVLKAQGGNPTEYKLTNQISYANTPQKGGYKSKHRRRQYKKSIGRKGRSRRFRGSRK